MLQIKLMVPVLPCQMTGLLHMECTASDPMLTGCRMTAISTASMMEIRGHIRLCNNDRCLINIAGREQSRQELNVELAVLPCWQFALLKGVGGCVPLEDTLQFPLLPSSSFWPLSRRLCPSLRSGTCFLFLCGFSHNNRIHSQGFNSPSSAAFTSLLSSGSSQPASCSPWPPRYPICIFSHKSSQFSGIFSVVKGIITISQSVGLKPWSHF